MGKLPEKQKTDSIKKPPVVKAWKCPECGEVMVDDKGFCWNGNCDYYAKK